ncbi:MAG: hypothetical protein M9939_25480 [Mesorhizobium sp.]|nr:hypothetical protein [Mesorhizobium sp.]MCO5164445.1 hypothetical protein [Mesorhizobium sp.]
MKRYDLAAGCAVLAIAVSAGVGSALADQVIPDDLIVQGSLCVGLDCVNGEVFNFATIRLKENNTRIDFTDTSASAGFATNDWRIQANDSNSGGANALSFRSMGASATGAEGGTAILTLTNGAPSNSVFVDSTGRVGFKTSTPVLDLHINTSNTPGIRLEQNSSGGFTAQTWDIAGNEANFFIRDVTGGSRLSFRIRPGAPTSSIDIASTGRVGIGNASPDSPMEIIASPTTIGTGNAVLKLVNPAGPTSLQFDPLNDGTFWNVAAGSNTAFNINRNGNATTELTLSDTGNMVISGTLTTGGPTCGGGCDAVFEPDYKLPSIEEHAASMWANKHLPNVGPTAPHAPVNLSERFGEMLNELETAHIYIEQLHKRIGVLEAEIERKAEN